VRRRKSGRTLGFLQKSWLRLLATGLTQINLLHRLINYRCDVHRSLSFMTSLTNHKSSNGVRMPNAKLTDDEERAKDIRFGTCG
jgi:hypothetical protein